MLVGAPREIYPGERRVALTPSVVPQLAKAGMEAAIERGAGAEAGYSDEDFAAKGARVLPSREELFRAADIVVQVLGPGANDKTWAGDLPLFRRGQILVAFLRPLGAIETVQALAQAGVDAFAVELMPRVTRAQNMDALSAMSTVAGYKAVLLAANALPRLFPMMTTAAGTITPARVLVIGAGVAGLQAIATARRLGAVVSAYDVRPAVKEQIQSLGARFVELPVEAENAQDAGGYARAQDESFYRRQRELLARVVAESDVVITTAVVPGRKAPVLVTADMVRGMAPGSVVVDLAAERGGNCELTRAGETATEHGVTIVGRFNLASELPHDASHMYSRNVAAFLAHLVQNGQARVEADDAIIRSTLLTHGGEIANPQVREFFHLSAAASPQAT